MALSPRPEPTPRLAVTSGVIASEPAQKRCSSHRTTAPILYADIDLYDIARAKRFADHTGHYGLCTSISRNRSLISL